MLVVNRPPRRVINASGNRVGAQTPYADNASAADRQHQQQQKQQQTLPLQISSSHTSDVREGNATADIRIDYGAAVADPAAATTTPHRMHAINRMELRMPRSTLIRSSQHQERPPPAPPLDVAYQAAAHPRDHTRTTIAKVQTGSTLTRGASVRADTHTGDSVLFHSHEAVKPTYTNDRASHSGGAAHRQGESRSDTDDSTVIKLPLSLSSSALYGYMASTPSTHDQARPLVVRGVGCWFQLVPALPTDLRPQMTLSPLPL